MGHEVSPSVVQFDIFRIVVQMQSVRAIKIDTLECKPFLKWAGGKRWLAAYPSYFDVQYDRYVEPFLGSGAIFFQLKPKRALLADTNSSLIEAYSSIKHDWRKVHRHLRLHHKLHSRNYYYKIRSRECKNSYTRAAQFIYLNRTCWNGLYRVNLDGKFNVPIGTKTSVLLPTDDFNATAKLLKGARLDSCDFEQILKKCGNGDFVFVDPPYTVKHNHNGFVKYNESLFSWEDQLRLRNCVELAVSRGAKVLVMNAYHSSVRDLYKGIGEMTKLERSSVISGKSSARGKYEEMLVKCF